MTVTAAGAEQGEDGGDAAGRNWLSEGAGGDAGWGDMESVARGGQIMDGRRR